MTDSNPLLALATVTTLRLVRHAVAPVAGALYLVLWIVAESGRQPLAPDIVMFSLYAIAIGLAVRLPRVSVALAVLIPLAQAVDLIVPPDSTTWPSSAGSAYALFFVGAFATPRVRLLGVPAAVLAGVLFGIGAGVPNRYWPYKWGSWTGSSAGVVADALLLAAGGVAVALAAWGLGIGVGWVISRVRLDVAWLGDRLKRVDVELRLSEDRARISRDIHDSLAHSLAVIVSQAQGAAALGAQRPEVATEALDTVTDVARSALVDVRNLVERIQADTDVVLPRLGVDDIPELVDSMRQVGMTVDLQTAGQERGVLTSAQEVAVYRIVQESLTNALKHAGPRAHVLVVLDQGENGLGIEVLSEGDGPLVAPAEPGVGIGVAGMKERARLAGGWLRAGPTGPEGDSAAARRFAVTAFVPAVRALVSGRARG